MVPLKNVPGILNAFKSLLHGNPGAELVMVGNRDNAMAEYSKSIGIPPANVKFKGEISYAGVAEEMKQADCLILFSDIENSPCVIGEALCCGLMVIATRVGGIPELVDDSNSILIERRDEAALTAAMQAVEGKNKVIDRRSISAAAIPLFSYDTIGKEITNVYESSL
jgi:glycosyltransferase involved in cell wall biosynthesis